MTCSNLSKMDFTLRSRIKSRGESPIKFRIMFIYLQKITIGLLFLIILSCEIQADEDEPGTYRDLTKALQNPMDVRVLNLSGEKLTALPKEIGQLQNLKSLYLSGNQLTTLPAEIGQLKNLKELYLIDNQLSLKERERIRKLLPSKCKIIFEVY